MRRIVKHKTQRYLIVLLRTVSLILLLNKNIIELYHNKYSLPQKDP